VCQQVDALVQTVAAILLYYMNHPDAASTHELHGHWCWSSAMRRRT
jgi:hypothetical protein